MSKSLDEWMTVTEAAQQKGVVTSAVRLAILAGRVQGLKKGRNWLVKRSDVEKWEPQRRARRKPESEQSE